LRATATYSKAPQKLNITIARMSVLNGAKNAKIAIAAMPMTAPATGRTSR